MESNICLICLEDINSTDILSLPKHCKCKVFLHLNCLDQIKISGLLCPICRIKKSQKILILQYNIEDQLLYYSNKILYYFLDNPNILRFILFICISFIVSIYILFQLIWIAFNDSSYRMYALTYSLTFVGIFISLFIYKLNELKIELFYNSQIQMLFLNESFLLVYK